MIAKGEFQHQVLAHLEEQGVVLRGVAQGQDKLHTKQDILLEQLSRLVELLTPEEKEPRDGLSVPELLEEIVAQATGAVRRGVQSRTERTRGTGAHRA